jgi:TolB-like protein/Flp pilus assembly protein TadD
MELERIIFKALGKDPDERYQHVDEMIVDLRRIRQNISGSLSLPEKKSQLLMKIAIIVIVLAVVGIYFLYFKSDSTPANRKSIAVLPFKNLSDSKEDEYFSDGITDDIIAQLSKISELKVISRTSTMQYKRMNKNVREIGEELDVATVLEGSVRRVGNQIRIVAQLIDAKNEGHLWAETYDKEMIQIFEVQSDVAKKIAVALKTKLTSGEKERIEKKQTEDTEAYKLYLKGRFYWNKRVLDDVKAAIDCFKQAIEKDPNYALAYAGLASAYAVIPSYGLLPAESYINARNAAMKALEIDSTLAEAHAVLGEIAGSHYYDWDVAEKHYRWAIELDPSYPTAHQWYSSMLMFLGRFDEALTEAKRALELDPLSLVISLNLGDVYYTMRRYDQAEEQYKNIIALDETFPWSHSGLAGIYEVQGRFDDAIAEYMKAKDLGGNMPYSYAILGPIYAKSGRKADALNMLDELLRLDQQGNPVSYGIANVYFELGEKEKAFEWLEKSYQNREMWLLVLGSDPLWDDIRSDPRGIALLKKMGLRK